MFAFRLENLMQSINILLLSAHIHLHWLYFRTTSLVDNKDAGKQREGEGVSSAAFHRPYRKPPGICVTVKGRLTGAPGHHGRNSMCWSCITLLFNSSIKEASQRILKGFMEQLLCLKSAQLARIFDSTLMSSIASSCKQWEKKKKKIFIGFPCTKDTHPCPKWHNIPGIDKMYHGNDYQSDDSTTTLGCLVFLISAVHSSIGNTTLSLNVFHFSSFCLMSTECIVKMWTCECTHN